MVTFEKIQKNIYKESPNVFKKHLLIIPSIKPSGLTRPSLKKGIAEYIDLNHKKDLDWLQDKYGISLSMNHKAGQLPSRLKKMKECSVRDIYNTNDEKQEKYESILMDTLLKHALRNNAS